MPVVSYHPEALNDIINDAVYLGEEASEETADRFLDSVDETLSNLVEMPLIGRFLDLNSEKLKDIHVWRVKDFEKWLIFYHLTEDGIEVVRLLHGTRDLHEALKHSDW